MIRIRTAVFEDIKIMLELIQSVERQISEDELETFMAIDPSAFHLAENEDTNGSIEIVGMCSGVIHHGAYGFLGLYIVRENFRSKGIGKRLWDAVFEHLGPMNIGLCGNIKSFEKYKNNFKYLQDYTIMYYKCDLSGANKGSIYKTDKLYHLSSIIKERDILKERSTRKTIMSKPENNENAEEFLAMDSIMTSKIKHQKKYQFSILSIYEGILQEQSTEMSKDQQLYTQNEITTKLIEYDYKLHRRYRSILICKMISWKNCRTKIALVSGNIVGYGCLRLAITGEWLISPLYADTSDVAEVLIQHFMEELALLDASKGVIIRFPSSNPHCSDILDKFGFYSLNESIYSGFTQHNVAKPVSKIYSFLSVVFCCE